MRGMGVAVRSLLMARISVLLKHKHNKNKQMLNNTEKSMIPIIRARYQSLSAAQKGMDILEEFSAGTGIADLVFFKPNQKEIKKRLSRHIPSITDSRELKVIQSIQVVSRQTIDQIASNCKLPADTVERILSDLIDRSIVVKRQDQYKLTYQIRSSADRSIAIEAKIKDWRSGIKQALRYKEFAHYVYLAVYDSKIDPCLQRQEMFEQLGIGLIGVRDNEITEYVKPTYNQDERLEFNELLASERYISNINELEKAFVVRNNFAG